MSFGAVRETLLQAEQAPLQEQRIVVTGNSGQREMEEKVWWGKSTLREGHQCITMDFVRV